MFESHLIIYHGTCPDGFGSAWLLRRALFASRLESFAKNGANVELFAGSYNDALDIEMCRDRHVWMVDFCYPATTLVDVMKVATTLRIMDHHQTSAEWVNDTRVKHLLKVYGSHGDMRADDGFFNFQNVAILDQSHSGAGIVAQYATHFGVRVPDWFVHLEDRDLWKFKVPGTASAFAAITARRYELEDWDTMSNYSSQQLIAQGDAIEMYRQRLIEQSIEKAFEVELFGHKVWIAQCPYAIGSDVAGKLAERTPELFGAYFIHDGETTRYGLRSLPLGMDVAELAALEGGGGHKHAAGFEIIHDVGFNV